MPEKTVMPKKEVKLDVTDIQNFVYDMKRCIKCAGCKWVEHTYMPGINFSMRCPISQKFLYYSYGAYGRLRIALSMLEGKVDYSDKLVDLIYQCQMCGACDVGCKRNLDLEIQLALEAMRVKSVADRKGPMPEHKAVADKIEKTNNRFGSPHDNRLKWLPADVKPAQKADIVYFVGCAASYTRPEIAQSTARILNASGTPLMLLPDEWCCGNPLYTVGMIDEAKRVAEHNIEAIKKAGASTVLVSCAECYRMLKVDYPRMLKKSTSDMPFKVVHLVEFVDELVKKGTLKLTNPVDMRLTYHDSCNLARLSEPWVQWEGTRGEWGCVSPPPERRRGTYGVYQQPRDILNVIPGLELVELIRIKENTLCCGAGGGVRDAFKDFALWTANERLEEVREIGAEGIVSACPYCKDNFSEAIKANGDDLKVYDISELIWQAVSK